MNKNARVIDVGFPGKFLALAAIEFLPELLLRFRVSQMDDSTVTRGFSPKSTNYFESEIGKIDSWLLLGRAAIDAAVFGNLPPVLNHAPVRLDSSAIRLAFNRSDVN